MTEEYIDEIKKKAEAFDRIAQRCYERNFGRLSKSDFDILMFDIFISSDKGKKMRDYEVSSALGISETKVRNLRVNAYLMYGEKNINWEDKFFDTVKHAQYDKDNHRIVMSIYDPNTRRYVEDLIEQAGLYSEYQLNNRLLLMRVDQFLSFYKMFLEKRKDNNGTFEFLGVNNGTEINIEKLVQDLAISLKKTCPDDPFDEAGFSSNIKTFGFKDAIWSFAKQKGPKAIGVLLKVFANIVTGGATNVAADALAPLINQLLMPETQKTLNNLLLHKGEAKV